MATFEQIKNLISSHFEGDTERFKSIALQVAAQEAKSGHKNVALEIKKIVDSSKNQVNFNLIHAPIIQTISGDISSLLTLSNPSLRIQDLITSKCTKDHILRLLAEQKERHNLQGYGLQAIRKVLLYGSPGTGKTMTASVIAGELHLPMFTIRLDGIITKYLGETAAKLRMVFDTIQRNRGVYLFDEFDALGAKRGQDNEVGEMRRVLNSFLQFLEQDQSESIIIAASNLLHLIDNALFRRFDDIIEYSLPSENEISELTKNILAPFEKENIDLTIVSKLAKGLSHSDIVSACRSAAKTAFLNNSGKILLPNLEKELQKRKKRTKLESVGK